MKVPKKNKWFSPMWLRVTAWQRSIRYSEWAWLITPTKMKAYDRAWYEWRTLGLSEFLEPKLRDFA